MMVVIKEAVMMMGCGSIAGYVIIMFIVCFFFFLLNYV